MHDCTETKEQITELLLDGIDCLSDEMLSAELRRCAECRNEFEALNAALRITTRSRELSAPPKDYWTTYHAKLRQRLVNVNTSPAPQAPSFFTRFVKYSVPVPAPVALALIVVCAVAITIAIRAARQQTPSQTPSVVHVQRDVPVIQEKIVTRVVYRNRRPVARTLKRSSNPATVDGTLANSQKTANSDVLAGFKPTEEVKLTVIKGGSTNEK